MSMKIVSEVQIPAGWVERREGEWDLRSDRESSQPLGVYISEFDKKIDYSGKTGFQCSLGEFAGRYCYVAPLRETRLEASTDCYRVMNNHKRREVLKSILDKCGMVTKTHLLVD